MSNQITLPRDAAGREIPLDTTVLYDGDGNAKEVQAFDYSPVESMWRVLLLDDSILFFTSDMYLTPTDSWEKLLEDLDAAGNARHEETCAYFNRDKDAYCCTSCPAYKDDCVLIAMRDIASRIRKLRSADE